MANQTQETNIQNESGLPILLLCELAEAELQESTAFKGLSQNFQLVKGFSPDTLLEYVLRRWQPEVGLGDVAAILIAEEMGFAQGAALLSSLKQMSETADIPVLVLGTGESSSTAELWLGYGAQGYVVKLQDSTAYQQLLGRGIIFWSNQSGRLAAPFEAAA